MKEVFREAFREMGKCYGVCDVILRMGRRRFGEPERLIVTELETLMDLEHLKRIADRLFDSDATSWQDLLATPYLPPSRRARTIHGP